MDSIKGQCPICGGHHLATYHGTKKRPYTGTPLSSVKTVVVLVIGKQVDFQAQLQQVTKK